MSPTRSRAFGYDRDVVRVRIRLVFILGLIAAAAAASCGGFEASDATAVDAGTDASVADVGKADVAVAAPPDASVDATVDPPGDPCAKCRSKHCDDKGACDPFVFITRDVFQGDLSQSDAGGEGLAKADEICRLAAAGGPGIFHAWLSDESQDAVTRVGGRSAPSDRPLRRHDGVVVANSIKDLIAEEDGGVREPINLGPNGELIPEDRVWTATDLRGRRTYATCGNWKSSFNEHRGVFGRSNVRDWTIIRDNPAELSCAERLRFYCVEEQH